MRLQVDIPTNGASLSRVLEGVIEASRLQWRAHPEWRPLYETRIRYQRPKPGIEKLQTSAELRAAGHGDCDRLTVDRVAELRERGGEEGACAYVYQTGPTTWHAVVRRGDGAIEDPSRIQKQRERKGWPPVSLNGDDDDTIPTKAAVDITALGDGRHAGKIMWQTGNARITVEAIGESRTNAAERALNLARAVAAHPAIRALLPPQAAIALVATDKLLALAKSGKLQGVARRLRGPALSLARKLVG